MSLYTVRSKNKRTEFNLFPLFRYEIRRLNRVESYIECDNIESPLKQSFWIRYDIIYWLSYHVFTLQNYGK